MPERRRTVRPLNKEILIPHVRDQEALANMPIDRQRYRARVRKRGFRPISDGWVCIMDEFRRRIAILNQRGIKINVGLAYFIAGLVTQAHHTCNRSENGELLLFEEYEVHTLHVSGCRVSLTLKEIADEYGIEESTVKKQVKLFKEWGLIVNYGYGFLEFDADLVWRGSLDARPGYKSAQDIHPKLEERQELLKDLFRRTEESGDA